MPLPPGASLGAYEIVSPLGAGGMGEVYRARDVKLGREVALKVLPASFCEDPERVARFQREAQLLASLNHPNIATIYGLEQHGATPFLILELVEGETLDARLKVHAIPVDEAMGIARQLADGLEAAHDKGIIHRDLKPGNIAITHDGVVKVLDFGLAKAMEHRPAGELSQSPTITFAATQAGMILGTAAYMSPEQAKGRGVDKRTDVWAFGCVLFEMLTGRRAFEGEDVTEVIAAIVRGEPAWNALPASVPDPIRLMLRRCLEKDRKCRIGDIAVARFLMTETIVTAPPPAAGAAPARRSRSRTIAVVSAVGGLIVGAAVAGAAARIFLRQTPPPRPMPARFSMIAPQSQALVLQGADRNLDFAPDASFIVYPGSTAGFAQLFVRALGDLDPRPLPGATDGRSPFISPDGQWVAYFSGQLLRKIPVAGGQPITVCRTPSIARGAAWAPDGTIVFGTSNSNTGLMAVSANGGEPKVLLKPPPDSPSYGFPSVAGDGTIVLFTIGTLGASPETIARSQIAALNRKTGEVKTLVRGGSQGQYVDGFLVYAAGDTIRAARFDLERLTLLGEPIPVLDRVQITPQGAANFVLSRDGSIAYVPASAGLEGAAARTLLWVTRDGQEEPLKLPARAYEGVRLSPDGTRAAVAVFEDQNDIWIGDLARQTLTRLTFDASLDQAPIWTPDGGQIIWSSQRSTGTPNVFRQAANGTGSVQQITANPNPTFPTSITPDGKRVLGWENSPVTKQDVMMVDLTASPNPQRSVTPLVRTQAIELGAEVSPDGRWLAYQSDESGRPEVFVRPFPSVDSGRWQISAAGGSRPLWARSGRELFYLDASGLLTSVAVTADTTFAAGNPTRVLNNRYYAGFTGLGLDLRAYDVAPDGRRFLMAKTAVVDRATASPSASMIVVLHWIEEVKSRIPAQ